MLAAWLAVGWVVCSVRADAASGVPAAGGTPRGSASRVVSINPSLTAILLALGARESLVGVDDYSARQRPEVRGLPRVGGLHDPSVEAVVALEPDLVVLVPSLAQAEFRQSLRQLGVPHLAFDPTRFDDVLATIAALGERVGRAREARQRVAEIRGSRTRIRERRAAGPRLPGVLVLTRDPLFLVGAGSFIDEMLESVGVENLARELQGTYPRASLEWLISRRPQVIVDAAGDDASGFWSRWPSLPAVRNHRVVSIPQGDATLPGPFLDRGLETLERAVHGAALADDAAP